MILLVTEEVFSVLELGTGVLVGVLKGVDTLLVVKSSASMSSSSIASSRRSSSTDPELCLSPLSEQAIPFLRMELWLVLFKLESGSSLVLVSGEGLVESDLTESVGDFGLGVLE